MRSRSEWTKESWITRKKKWPSGFSPEGLKVPRNTTESALRGWVTRRKNLGSTGLRNTKKQELIHELITDIQAEITKREPIKKPLTAKTVLEDLYSMESFSYVYGGCPNKECKRFARLDYHYGGFCNACWTDIVVFKENPLVKFLRKYVY